MRRISKSGLCEVALARDAAAAEVLREFGLRNVHVMLDPAFFATPVDGEGSTNILGWRDSFIEYKPSFVLRYPLRWAYGQLMNKSVKNRRWDKSHDNYTKLMQEIFRAMREPKMGIVHDNREVRKAEELFGANYVFYSTDYREVFKQYSRASRYVGSRIHGVIPSIVHGASSWLIYGTRKAEVLNSSLEILSHYIPGIAKHLRVGYLRQGHKNFNEWEESRLDRESISVAILKEKQKVRSVLKQQPVLSTFLS